LVLDRVGPDPFRPEPGRAYDTLIVPVRVAATTGMVRLWLPRGAVETLEDGGDGQQSATNLDPARVARLTAQFHAHAATASFPRGLGRLRVGGIVPLDGRSLTGAPQTPKGPVVLATRPERTGVVFEIPAALEPVADGLSVRVQGPIRRRRTSSDPSRPEGPAAMPDPSATRTDLPVTLTVELGRIGLTVEQLADLKPGDVLNLSRHSREPVELTSGGRLVARGELVLIDTELGVRITTVLL
jgi:type III secretion system YscQ/HrcQ family protein